MDTVDAVVPPRSQPHAPGVAVPAGAPQAPGVRQRRGRGWALVSLGTGVTALVVAALGVLAVVALAPVVLGGLLGTASLRTATVALVRSRARVLVTTLLAAAGVASTGVAAVVTVATLLLPFGLPPLDDPAAPSPDAVSPERLPEDLLAGFSVSALPLGRATVLGTDDVAVAGVRTDPADVAARVDEITWIADEIQDLGGVDDLVLVELDAPVDSGGWADVVEDGEVTVVTAEGRPYSTLVNRGTPVYEVTEVFGLDAHGVLRGRVVVAVAMPPAAAEGGMVVLVSTDWTDVATWSVPAG